MDSSSSPAAGQDARSLELAALLREAISLALPGVCLGEAGHAVTNASTGASEETVAAARDALARTRRLLAAGDLSLGLRHAMNNSLTTVLAEAQLLAMEELPAEAEGAVGRIVENTRRLVAIVRKLDENAPR